MRYRTLIVPVVASGLAIGGACRGASPRPAASPAAPRLLGELQTPAAPGSGEPNLAHAPGGGMFLTWVEPASEERHRLMLSRRDPGGQWSAPRPIAEGSGWFVNWADFPSLAAADDGTLFAHWLVRGGSGGYDYGIRIAVSRDGGATWSAPVTPHRDDVKTEHGFVSLVQRAGGGMRAVWLDGRSMKTGMRLMTTTIDAQADLGEEAVIDDRVCDCCQTAATRTSAGVLVAYRDRSPSEIRDISVSRETGAGWTAPQTVGADGWEINGCPVNGPALASRGRDVALAWFAAPKDESRVQVAFSRDEGASFGPAIRVDDGKPAGRVDVVLLDDGDALVSWLESAAHKAEVRVRRVRSEGTRGPSLVAAGSSTARSAGFPRMERAGPEVLLAWRDAADPPRIHTAVVQP